MMRVVRCVVLALILAPTCAWAQTPVVNMPEMQPLNRFPRMMQEYLVRRVRAVESASAERIMDLASRAEAEAYIAERRSQMREVFGEWPERNPLNARTVGTLERDGFVVERVIFDSRPNFPVTANLYLPADADGPAPGVLVSSGHSREGKGADYNQFLAQSLARRGFVALAYDSIGQGERLQYPDEEGQERVGSGTREHNFIWRQQCLVGEFFGSWRAWDGMRALDYLVSRPEVDTQRLGITGVSGGGTLTSIITANESRLTMSAPGCYITTWRRETENELPADAEQMPPGILGLGMEMYDMLVPHIPDGLILLTEEQDFFDQRGSLEAHERLAHIYRLMGAEDKLAYYVGPGGHSCPQPMREAMVAHFAAVSGMEIDAAEPELVADEDAALWCTESGNIGELAPTTCFDFTRELSQALAQQRGKPSGDELVARVVGLLDLPDREDEPEYRILRGWTNRGYARPYASHFVLETEPEWDAQAIVTKLEDEPRAARPQTAQAVGSDGSAVLYIPDRSCDAEMREDERVRRLTTENEIFFACDHRGVGESMPETCNPGSYDGLYGSDYFYAANAMMLGESYVAWRVHDTLSTLDWMASFGYDKVHLVAVGQGAISGALAALLHPNVRQVTLINAPTSYADLAETKYQQWTHSAMLPDVLAHFDLPDVYRELAGRALHIHQPLNAERQPLDHAAAVTWAERIDLDASVIE